jgi:KUP system potassium uptake protein
MNSDTPSVLAARSPNASLLALSALGVVFGDIGTSPLYAFENSFVGDHKLPIDFFHVMGVLSLIFWSLILVVTVKYVFITMRADNQGEGGSFALLAYIRRQAPQAKILGAISLAALLATALFYGDAIITPAISVLSAVEGLSLINPGFTAAEVPITIGILIALFAVQSRGTGVIGRFFGPVMLVWFAAIGVLGLLHVAATLACCWPSTPYGAWICCLRTRGMRSSCWVRWCSPSPAPRRYTPIWAISGACRSLAPGCLWRCPA